MRFWLISYMASGDSSECPLSPQNSARCATWTCTEWSAGALPDGETLFCPHIKAARVKGSDVCVHVRCVFRRNSSALPLLLPHTGLGRSGGSGAAKATPPCPFHSSLRNTTALLQPYGRCQAEGIWKQTPNADKQFYFQSEHCVRLQPVAGSAPQMLR